MAWGFTRLLQIKHLLNTILPKHITPPNTTPRQNDDPQQQYASPYPTTLLSTDDYYLTYIYIYKKKHTNKRCNKTHPTHISLLHPHSTPPHTTTNDSTHLILTQNLPNCLCKKMIADAIQEQHCCTLWCS